VTAVASASTTRAARALAALQTRRLRIGLVIAIGVGVATAFGTVPQWLGPADQYTAGLVVIAILLALSFNLMLGTTGMVSFGHAGFYGVGAYSVALIATKTQGDAMTGLVVAPVVGAITGAAIGAICLRAVRLYFSLLTLALAQLLYVIAFQWDTLTGGDNGIHGIPVPEFLNDPAGSYYFVLCVVAGAALLLWVITHSPFGCALRAIRENRQRAAFVGIRVKVYELAAFTVASSLAALAGGLYAVYVGQASPDLMFWTESATPVVMVLIGGMRSFYGPVLGAVFYTVLATKVRNSTNYWDLIIGGIVLLVVLILPTGLVGAPRRLWELIEWSLQGFRGDAHRAPPVSAPAHLVPTATVTADAVTAGAAPPSPAVVAANGRAAAASNGALLEVSRLGKRFGELVAVHDVDLAIREGTVHAVIGPNGAGKSTLFNLVSGLIRPDDGRVTFAGRDITGARAARLAHAGLGRAFQTTSIFGGLSVADNVRLAAMAIRGDTRWPVGFVPSRHQERVDAVLENVGLTAYASTPARELSHGDQRALELGISLALDARLLMLDEPTAGMSPFETRRTLELLRRTIKDRGITLLLIEHDMEVVFGIAETVTVMADGTVLVEGTPDEVRRHPEVIRAYLGEPG